MGGAQSGDEPMLAQLNHAHGLRHTGVVQAVSTSQGNCSMGLVHVLHFIKQDCAKQSIERQRADDGRRDHVCFDGESFHVNPSWEFIVRRDPFNHSRNSSQNWLNQDYRLGTIDQLGYPIESREDEKRAPDVHTFCETHDVFKVPNPMICRDCL